MVLLEDELQESSLDEIFSRVVGPHLDGLKLAAFEAGVTVLRKVHLGP